MKRLISLIISGMMVLSCTSVAFAAESDNTVPINVIVGSVVERTDADIDTRAITEPTTFAPQSWYGVTHAWTAKYYTWSSYIFDFAAGYYFRCVAMQPYSVEFYYDDGTYMATVESYRSGEAYVVEVSMSGSSSTGHDGYYVKIVNEGSQTISSGATYFVDTGL